MAARLSFGIDQLWGKLHLRQRLSETDVLNYGLSVQHYHVQGGRYEPVGEASRIKIDQLQKEKAMESAVYIDYERALTEKLSVTGGLRYTMFNALGPRDVNHYHEGELPSEATLLETRSETGIIKISGSCLTITSSRRMAGRWLQASIMRRMTRSMSSQQRLTTSISTTTSITAVRLSC